MARSRVIGSGMELTGGQQAQLETDRAIKTQRQADDAANKLAQIEAQNQGQRDTTFLAATGALARENISQQGATQRQQMGDDAATNMTNIRETAQTGRQQSGDMAAMARLSAGHGFTMEQMTKKDQFDTAGDHRKAAAAALVAGAPGVQVNQAMNANPGFPVDYSGVQVPVRNSQQDQFQFVEQDNGPGQPKTIMAGNKQAGTISPAASALATGRQAVQAQPAATPAQPGAAPSAADSFSKVYQSNPQRLQEDTEFAASQIGTVYKTDEEQLSYLNSVRKTNPTLFQSLKQRLGQQPAVR